MKKIRRFLILLTILPLLSSCWSKKELNELAIATALGIDKKEDEFVVTAQVLNPAELAGKARSTRTEVVKFTASGKTIYEAVRKLLKDTPRTIYVAHLRQVIFGEEMARAGIAKSLDALSRHHEMRTDFHLNVARGGTAEDILNVQTALEKIPADKLTSAIDNAEIAWGGTKTVTMDELIGSLISKGKEPVLTGVYVYGKPEKGSDIKNVQNVSPTTGLRVDSIGVFKRDKLIGWLDEEESKGLNYITDNMKAPIVSMPCEEGMMTIEVGKSKTTLGAKMKNGIPKIDIKVETEGSIGEISCKVDLSNQQEVKELEKKYEETIKKAMAAAVKTAQEKYQSDIFGFGEVMFRKEPKAWKKLEPNWDEEFPELEVSMEVNAHIRRFGSTTNTLEKDIKG